MVGYESMAVVTKWDQMDCAIQIYRKHYWRVKFTFFGTLKNLFYFETGTLETNSFELIFD